MPSGHGRDRLAARHNLSNDPRLVLVAPRSPTTRTGEHLEPMNRLSDSIIHCVHSKPNGYQNHQTRRSGHHQEGDLRTPLTFNSLDAQYDAASAYIKSQAHAGWTLIRSRYDDGGYSGGSTDRPDLQKLLDDIRARKVDVIVVYKVDRLTRSLADFAKLVELFDAHGVSFVSVTQQFNTTTSMGRLTLNVLLSFAQFEREVTSERIRDKIAASKRKGLWVGGPLPLGYAMKDGKIAVVKDEAERVRLIYRRYLELSGVNALVRDLKDIRTKLRLRATGAT